MLDNGAIGQVLLVEVLLIEDLGPLTEILANFLLLFLGEECRRTWPPGELLETLDMFFSEKSALEVV
jgi:hypothetical protein